MRRSLFALLVVTGSLLAVASAPAMAAVHWNTTTKGMQLSGSVTVKKNGASPKTCTPAESQTSEFLSSTEALVGFEEPQLLYFSCEGGLLAASFDVKATSTKVVEVRPDYALPYQDSPWGGYYSQGVSYAGEVPMVADFVFGAPSKIVFNEDVLGVLWDGAFNPEITMSGSLKVTTASGGPLYLLP